MKVVFIPSCVHRRCFVYELLAICLQANIYIEKMMLVSKVPAFSSEIFELLGAQRCESLETLGSCTFDSPTPSSEIAAVAPVADQLRHRPHYQGHSFCNRVPRSRGSEDGNSLRRT